MQYTQDQVKKAVISLAKECGQEDAFTAMAPSAGMERLIEKIVYELFLRQFDSRSCDQPLRESYQTIHAYAKELKENGSVEFAH